MNATPMEINMQLSAEELCNAFRQRNLELLKSYKEEDAVLTPPTMAKTSSMELAGEPPFGVAPPLTTVEPTASLEFVDRALRWSITSDKSILDDIIAKDYTDHASAVINDNDDAFPPRHNSFPSKLHSLLSRIDSSDTAESTTWSHIISWQPHGRSFCIRNASAFQRDVLPAVFRIGKLSTFYSQLSLYGFATCGDETGEYFHERFLRDRTALASTMKRVPRRQRTSKPQASSMDGFSHLPEVTRCKEQDSNATSMPLTPDTTMDEGWFEPIPEASPSPSPLPIIDWNEEDSIDSDMDVGEMWEFLSNSSIAT